MGATHSHEAATAVLGPREAVHKPYKSTAIPPLQRPHSESGAAHSPLSTVCASKIKLNGLSTGDATTCCTTTCNSSISGVSASPVTHSTGIGEGVNAVAITLSSGSPLERSDSAQAVSSIAGQSPPAFHAIDGLDDAEEDTKGAATETRRWSRRTPRVQGLLKTLRLGAVRSRSQPAPDSSSHEHPGNVSASTNESTSLAAALHAHILREEEEHRRRRHSSLPESHPEVAASQAEHRPHNSSERFEDHHRCLQHAGNSSRTATSCRPSVGGDDGAFSLQCRVIGGAETQVMQVSSQAILRRPRGSPALEPSHRAGLGASRWIAEAPTNGRWEMERGAWNRQGVHLNHLNVADERFRALAATRRLSPLPHAAQSPGVHGTVGPQSPLPQPRKVLIAPLAGRLQENQQRLLQSGHQVMPVTHRGVAAATTIELARSRHANDEKRRHQHYLIASPEPEQSTSAATDTHRVRFQATGTSHKLSTGGEGRRHDFSMAREPCSARDFASLGMREAALKDNSVPAPCFRQVFAARDRHNSACCPSTSDSPKVPETAGGREAGMSMYSDIALAQPVPVCEQQRNQEDKNALHRPNWGATVKPPAKSNGLPGTRASSAIPFGSRALQRNAFVANPRTQVGAPKRRPR